MSEKAVAALREEIRREKMHIAALGRRTVEAQAKLRALEDKLSKMLILDLEKLLVP